MTAWQGHQRAWTQYRDYSTLVRNRHQPLVPTRDERRFTVPAIFAAAFTVLAIIMVAGGVVAFTFPST